MAPFDRRVEEHKKVVKVRMIDHRVHFGVEGLRPANNLDRGDVAANDAVNRTEIRELWETYDGPAEVQVAIANGVRTRRSHRSQPEAVAQA
jgi:hypothetical protein